MRQSCPFTIRLHQQLLIGVLKQPRACERACVTATPAAAHEVLFPVPTPPCWLMANVGHFTWRSRGLRPWWVCSVSTWVRVSFFFLLVCAHFNPQAATCGSGWSHVPAHAEANTLLFSVGLCRYGLEWVWVRVGVGQSG